MLFSYVWINMYSHIGKMMFHIFSSTHECTQKMLCDETATHFCHWLEDFIVIAATSTQHKIHPVELGFKSCEVFLKYAWDYSWNLVQCDFFSFAMKSGRDKSVTVNEIYHVFHFWKRENWSSVIFIKFLQVEARTWTKMRFLRNEKRTDVWKVAGPDIT